MKPPLNPIKSSLNPIKSSIYGRALCEQHGEQQRRQHRHSDVHFRAEYDQNAGSLRWLWSVQPMGTGGREHLQYLQEIGSGWWFQTWLLFSISYMGCHPSHWLKRCWLLLNMAIFPYWLVVTGTWLDYKTLNIWEFLNHPNWLSYFSEG